MRQQTVEVPTIIGQNRKRLDAPAKAKGKTLYAGDHSYSDMLHVALVRSTIPHGYIRKIELNNIPEGVYCYTAKDFASNIIPSIKTDQPILASDKVRFYGEPIAIVAADTVELARKVASSIQVEYEALEVVDSPIDALRKCAEKVHENGNLCGELHVKKGNIEEGFLQSDFVIEESFSLPIQEHGYLEPEVAVTYMDEEGCINLVAATQNIFADRDLIAHSLGIASDRVKGRAPAVGGGFGGKDGNTAQAFVAIVTHKTGRPARYIFSRKENIQASYKRHAAKVSVKMGFSKKGRILAFEGKLWFDTGAYAALGPAVLSLGTEHFAGPYHIKNTKIDSYLSYTNHAPASAMRGFGAPQGAMATESIINQAATHLGMDPIEIRIINAIRKGQLGAIGQEMEHSVGFVEALEQFRQSDFYREMIFASSNGESNVGYGIAAGMMSSGMGKGIKDSATAKIEKKGQKYIVSTGIVDIGQGSETALAMIAAEVLGVPMESICMQMADTENTGDCGSTAASRSVYIVGNAIVKAAKRIKMGEVEVVETAYFPESKTNVGVPGLPHAIYGFIVQGTKLKIDQITGEIELLWVHNTTEAGKIINPTSMNGQIYGGIAMATGYTLSEQLRYKNGMPMENGFENYIMPTSMDIPKMTNDNVVCYEESGPYGAKGIAEASTVALAPAMRMAIQKIVPEAKMNQLPFDREEILRGMAKEKVNGITFIETKSYRRSLKSTKRA